MNRIVVIAVLISCIAVSGWSERSDRYSKRPDLYSSVKEKLAMIAKLQDEILSQVNDANTTVYNTVTTTNFAFLTVTNYVVLTNVVTVQKEVVVEKRDDWKDNNMKRDLKDTDEVAKFILNLDSLPGGKRMGYAQDMVAKLSFTSDQASQVLNRIPEETDRFALLQAIVSHLTDRDNRNLLVTQVKWEKMRGPAIKVVESAR
jgi:hypothetical protein